jgi:hypothetical protein
MNDQTNFSKPNGHGDYERRDISVAGVLYFLVALAIGGVIVHFVAQGLFKFLDYRFETSQPPVSPLVKNAPSDTRRIPPKYNDDYQKYLQEQFPAPQLEINERTELNDVRKREEDILSTYGWVDQNAGTVHIPIDRAMDLLAQRGLPVRQQQEGATTQQQSKRGPKQ